MDHLATTVQEIQNRWQEAYAEYREKESAFMQAWQRFNSDCDQRDHKVEEQKSALLTENQKINQQLEGLGSQYTSFMLDGQQKAADEIKQQMTELSSRRIVNEVLIDSIGKPEYSKALLQEAESAFEQHGDASNTLEAARSEMMNVIDDMLKALEALKESMRYAGDGTLTAKYANRMYRRFRHLPEEDVRIESTPAMSFRREVINGGSER